MPKSHSGIKRGSKSGGTAKMSPEDKFRIQLNEQNIERENEMIPSFVHDDMTREEIRDAIISEIRRTGEMVAGVSPVQVDGRFSAAKDKYFAPLIRGLNATEVKGYLEGRSKQESEFFISRAEALTKNYSTKDLRRFILDEIGESIYRGGRNEYVTRIGLALADRFNPRGIAGIGIRHTLTEPDSMLISRADSIGRAIARRSIYRQRIAEIQAKYKGGKK